MRPRTSMSSRGIRIGVAAAVLGAAFLVPITSRAAGGEGGEQGRQVCVGTTCVNQPPTPETQFLTPPLVPLLQTPCAPESRYDMPSYYGTHCSRLRFSFGPILARPGQTDLLIQPSTIEQPRYEGYVVRWKPGLVDALGNPIAVEKIHLHHGTWLQGNNYGSSPFFATGEEQTVLSYPQGYGQHWGASDPWIFLHMVHNLVSSTQPVFVTYDIDYVPQADAVALGLKNTKSVWLDAGSNCGGWAVSSGSRPNDCKTYSLNPIFNLQKGFGHVDTGAFNGYQFTDATGNPIADPGATGRLICDYPRENCANFNSSGVASAQQGIAKTNVVGWDWTVDAQHVCGASTCPAGAIGTIVTMGGHLHPGGIRDEVSLVRNGVAKPIHISDAIYWDHLNHVAPDGPVTSWDLSMTGVVKDRVGWAVQVQVGDKLRLNGVYDTSYGSSYEQMAIVMNWISPNDASGVDVFSPNTVLDPGFPVDNGAGVAVQLPSGITGTCHPGYSADTGKTTLCLRGSVSHGSQGSRQNHATCGAGLSCPALTTARVALPSNPTIPIQGFNYGVTDMATAQALGIPVLKLGDTITFVNLDAGADIWHTLTRCALPCTGGYSTNYPVADGGTATNPLEADADDSDFDSTTLGVGLGAPGIYGADTQTNGMPDIQWSWRPQKAGTYAFWCRIHPFMRGVFAVQ